MAIDITSSFRKCVHERRTQNELIYGDNHSKRSKPFTRRKCPLVNKFKEVTKRITELRDFLLEHRKSYLSLNSDYLNGNNVSPMTDEERDKIDSGALAVIKTSSLLINDCKIEISNNKNGDQASETHKAIVDLLETYLKCISKIFSEMKAVRVKWAVEVQKMSKFDHSAEQRLDTDEKDNLDVDEKVPSGTTFSPSPTTYNYDDDAPLSEEEMQMFQMENDHLYNELNSLNDEVKSIQRKVVKIAELQEVFTEKVLEQNEDIERISSTLVGTTENLKDANTQIRQAIQSNASFRIYVLFFILVMSFCLLFLDWYND